MSDRQITRLMLWQLCLLLLTLKLLGVIDIAWWLVLLPIALGPLARFGAGLVIGFIAAIQQRKGKGGAKV